MELPSRPQGDTLLAPGEMTQLKLRLRNMAHRHDLTSIIACAFDHRTRMLPFLYADMQMAPAGVRAIGSAMVDAGFPKTRVVLQQWNPHFRPSRMQLDGRVPDLFMVSSMLLHTEPCRQLIRDACRIAPEHRPLILAGGPKVIYEPWDVFSSDPADPWGADVAVTGEEYVLLELLEVILSTRAEGESMRSAFRRARDAGALDAIPGLVYPRTDARGRVEELVDTGIQRLLGDLDELPHPTLGYELLEAPSSGPTLAPAALPADRVRKHCRVSSIVMTLGCKFRCSYCPIPAYNQRQQRGKSGERIADEIGQIYDRFGIRLFFGCDDNFLADPRRALDVAEVLARRVDAGSRPHCKVRWATEATVHDTIQMKEHLPLFRKAGLRALWLGVEDLTGALVQKGQNKNRTIEAFSLLRENGIFPIPMMMHHDEQPLISLRDCSGLLNQLTVLRKAGAVYMQVLMLTPAPGSKSYEDCFHSSLAMKRVSGQQIEGRHMSALHVVASRHGRPWTRQLNLIAAYAYFFNPLRLLAAMLFPKTSIPRVDEEAVPAGDRPPKLTRRLRRKLVARLADPAIQAVGIYGLLRTVPPLLGWTWRLWRGPIERQTAAPSSRIPMRSPDGSPARHALDTAPVLVEKIA
ncbi:MAG: radical SAM protein [Patescibacteria group bacterium]|nr:radical SAM protein [Patescibacteria group bacterium]